MARTIGSKNKSKKQFCLRGHDTFVYGRDGSGCSECRREDERIDPTKDSRITQFCPKGHDKNIVGKDAHGICIKCRREYDIKSQKRVRIKRVSMGLCIMCGKRPPTTEKQCNECNLKCKSYRDRYKILVMKHYGNQCSCCKESNLIFLTIDHVNGGGTKHRQSGGRNIYRYLIRNNFPFGYQILCWNCNWAKYTQEKCPHKM